MFHHAKEVIAWRHWTWTHSLKRKEGKFNFDKNGEESNHNSGRSLIWRLFHSFCLPFLDSSNAFIYTYQDVWEVCTDRVSALHIHPCRYPFVYSKLSSLLAAEVQKEQSLLCSFYHSQLWWNSLLLLLIQIFQNRHNSLVLQAALQLDFINSSVLGNITRC